MAYTTEQLTALEQAIAAGALTVRHSDRTITYRSLDEMRSILADMKQSLGASGANTRRIYYSHGKGL